MKFLAGLKRLVGLTTAEALTLDEQILGALSAARLTCEEIETRIGRTHQAVSGNLTHLRDRGAVFDTGRRRPVRSGRPAIVWGVA